MPRVSAAAVTCPRVEHVGSRVKLDGTYGKPGHRRQRYRCSPRGGGKPHVFTELLPREESWRDSCEHCERRVERREGPKAPRHYQFVARGIAEALHAVGAGASYMHASRVTRDRARRFRFDPETGELRESDHGQLVADWVELFAPVVFAAHRCVPGRPRARCCSTTCRSGSGPLTPAGGGSRRGGSPSTSSARSVTGRASRGSGAPRHSRARTRLIGARFSARWPASPSGSSGRP